MMNDPSSIKTEQALVAALILDPDGLNDPIVRQVRVEDFLSPGMRDSFDAILSLSREGRTIDSVTIADELSLRGRLEAFGNFERLVELLRDVPVVFDPRAYAARVITSAKDRRRAALAEAMQREISACPANSARIAREFADRIRELDPHEDLGPGADDGFTAARAVKREAIEWLWKPYIARAVLSLVGGAGGTGKTTAVLDIIARLSAGRMMPDGTPNARKRVVLYVTAEDPLGSVLRPRLEAAGADLNQVFLFDGAGRKLDEAFTKELVRFALREKVECIVFDTLPAFIPKGVDEHRNADLQSWLGPVCAIGALTGAAIVGLTHLNKDSKASGIARFCGSVAWGNRARTACAVFEDPHDPVGRRLVLGILKSNIGPTGLGVPFAIRVDASDGEEVCSVAWSHETVRFTEHDVFGAPMDAVEREERDDGMDLVREALKDGPKSWRDIRTAVGKGSSEKALIRARRGLGCLKQRLPDGKVLWSLPPAKA